MIYQIDYIDHEHWVTNCTFRDVNVSRNDAEWVGLRKTNHLSFLLKGYVGKDEELGSFQFTLSC